MIGAWRGSPLDRWGWLPLLIWIAPLIQLAANRDPRLRLEYPIDVRARLVWRRAARLPQIIEMHATSAVISCQSAFSAGIAS